MFKTTETMDMDAPFVELKGVDFSYNGDVVLQGVDLTVNRDDFIAIIGPNGGGKSTLLKLILGLIEPKNGQIKVMGGTPRKFSSAIGYVPQNVNVNENFPITAMDVVMMGTLEPGKRPGWSDKMKARQLALMTLERLHMASHAYKRIGELSGGQRQRIFIARSLITKPKLLLLDEPTASIDTRGQTEFYELLTELNNEVAIVVVSHDLVVISNYVKSVACVNRRLHYHPHEEITGEVLQTMYACSVEDVCRVQVLAGAIADKERIDSYINL